LSPPEDQVVFPAVPTSVTAGADIPSWTYCTLRRFDRRTTSWLVSGFATACFSLGSHEPGSCSPTSRRRAPASFRMPLPSVPGLPSSFRVSPENRRRAFGLFDVLGSAPLMGSRSLQRSPTQRIRFVPGIPTSPAVASSGFEPSRRLDPLRAFPVSLPGPLLGLLPSGLFSARRSEPSFEAPYPPGIA
jgi:hypothetical protein